MANQQYGGGRQPRSHSRRQRRGEGPFDSPPYDTSEDEDAHFRGNQGRPLEESPYHDTYHTSSRRHRHRARTSTTRGVDGSEISASQYDTYREHRRTSRYPTPDTVRLPDPFDGIFPPPRFEDRTLGAGDWTDEPPSGGRPEPTYGHNGLHHPDYRHSQPGPDMLDLPPPPSWPSQQHIEPRPRSRGGGRHSRRDEPPRPRSRDRGTIQADDRQERHTSHERRERHHRQDRHEYHETHEYSEHRDRESRDQDRRRNAREEHGRSGRNGRRRRSRSREPRYR